MESIADTLKSLDSGVQNISKIVVGEGADKDSKTKTSSASASKNPFDGLEKVIGGASFRTASKDILVASLNQWIQNSDFIDQLTSKLNEGASEARIKNNFQHSEF